MPSERYESARPVDAESGGILRKRQRKNNLLPVHSPGVAKTETEVKRLGAARAWYVRQLQRLAETFAANVLDDQSQRCAADALTLKPGVYHEAPNSHRRFCRGW